MDGVDSFQLSFAKKVGGTGYPFCIWAYIHPEQWVPVLRNVGVGGVSIANGL
jgi:hypothetical protein